MFLLGLAVGLVIAVIGVVIAYNFAKGNVRKALERAVTLPDSAKDKLKAELKL